VKRLLALLAGAFGLTALLRRRQRSAPVPPALDPAVDLRAKLAETRATADAQREEAESPEPTVDDRRADVHARARQAIDELRD
jgi:hypothetical protein